MDSKVALRLKALSLYPASLRPLIHTRSSASGMGETRTNAEALSRHLELSTTCVPCSEVHKTISRLDPYRRETASHAASTSLASALGPEVPERLSYAKTSKPA